MRKKLLYVFAVLTALTLVACDPLADELNKAKNIDIERMTGQVSAKAVEYFEMGENKGKPFYSVTIANSDNYSETFRGVSSEVFDSVEVGTILPKNTVLTLERLSKIEGVVIDLRADLDQQKWFMAVKNAEVIKIYQVDRNVFYRYINVGLKLPIKINER